MHKRPENWSFGPVNAGEDNWWSRHEPTVDRWLRELEEAGDPWWQSAAHAAYCLVSYGDSYEQDTPSWDFFDTGHFLFSDLWEGGTVGFFGSVPIFADHLIEAMRRFVADGLVDRTAGERWLGELAAARGDFVRCYDEATSEEEAIAIARRYYDRKARGLPPALAHASSGG